MMSEPAERQHVVVVTQPTYMPWLGYFEQVARADTFVFLDTVQFARRSWQCRNRLKGPDGRPFWLTVPIAAHPRDTAIADVRIAPGSSWRDKHLRSIRTSLGRTPFFDEIFPHVERWLNAPTDRLADLHIGIIRGVSDLLGLQPRFACASELEGRGRRTALLVDLVRRVGGTHYYSARGSKEYMEADADEFRAAGLTYSYQEWEHPEYPQRGETFQSHLSVLDALMNLGPEETAELLAGAGDVR